MHALMAMAAMLALAMAGDALAQQIKVSHGRFKDVMLYSAKGEVRQFVLLLSGDGGWDEETAGMARALSEEGALVAGIDLPQLVSELETDGATCLLPDGDLENLSHFLQASQNLPDYLPPVLVGKGAGAAWVYAMLAQAPVGTFAGGVSAGFCPALSMKKLLCKGEGLVFSHGPTAKGVRLMSPSRLRMPWLVVEGAVPSGCDDQVGRDFVTQVPGGDYIALPKAEREPPMSTQSRFARIQAGVARIAMGARPPPRPASLPDLPINEVPATAGEGGTFALLLSGDGGWAGLDKEVAAGLAARGIPVAGIDSLRYFWQARTPDGLAQDVARTVRYYAYKWKKARVLLIGYSQGADVLPFAVNRLPADVKAMVRQTVLLGIGERASFEFHLSNWLTDDGDEPILPEVRGLAAETTLCIHGAEEASPCDKAYAAHVKTVRLTGGHHFGGDYAGLVSVILSNMEGR